MRVACSTAVTPEINQKHRSGARAGFDRDTGRSRSTPFSSGGSALASACRTIPPMHFKLRRYALDGPDAELLLPPDPLRSCAMTT
jgi:hypothetical protein